MPEITDLKVRELDSVPAGHRGLGKCMHETHRAYLFEYYGQELFIPKRVVIKASGSYWAPAWAIENAKAFNSRH